MTEPNTYPGYRFPAEIISDAVWLYHVFSLSLRDVELILAERGITVTHESIRCWCRKFGSKFAAKLRHPRPRPGDTWPLDELYLRINGQLFYVWRAVDQDGVVLDILFRSGGPPQRPSASSSACLLARSTSRGASSRTTYATMAWRNASCCPRCGTGPAGT